MRCTRHVATAAVLFAAVGCATDPTAPTPVRSPVAGAALSASDPPSPTEARYSFPDGRWISIDLATRVLRVSSGEAVTSVPDAEALKIVNILGTMESIDAYFAAHPIPEVVDHNACEFRVWDPCRPENEFGVPTEPIGDRASAAEFTPVTLPVLIRRRREDGSFEISQVHAQLGQPVSPLASGWAGRQPGTGEDGTFSVPPICHAPLRSLTLSYTHYAEMRNGRSQGLFQQIVDAGATAIMGRAPATWGAVGIGIANGLAVHEADLRATALQLALLHVYASSYGCLVRSPSYLGSWSYSRYIGVPGMGLPASNGGGGGSGTTSGFGKVVCTAMIAEISVDGGHTWVSVQTTVCQAA